MPPRKPCTKWMYIVTSRTTASGLSLAKALLIAQHQPKWSGQVNLLGSMPLTLSRRPDDDVSGECEQVAEHSDLANAFSCWCARNCLILNTHKTKEMVIDFRRSKPPLQQVSISGMDIKVVQSYRYLGMHLDCNLDWSAITEVVYKKSRSRLFLLRKLRSFDVCGEMLHMFYQSVVAHSWTSSSEKPVQSWVGAWTH